VPLIASDGLGLGLLILVLVLRIWSCLHHCRISHQFCAYRIARISWKAKQNDKSQTFVNTIL